MTPYDGPALWHLGYIKTGTTTLQQEVFNAPDWGLGLAGGARNRPVLISELVLTDGYSFDPVATAALFAALEQPVRASGRIPVWSDETLLGNPLARRYDGHAVAQRLTALGHPARILVTIREQRAFALSAYGQYLVEGGQHSLRDFVGTGEEAESFTPILRPDHLEYDRAIGFYQDLFGAEQVLVLPLELLSRDPGAYFARLAAFLEIPQPGGFTPRTHNARRRALPPGVTSWVNRIALISPLHPRLSRAQRIMQRGLKLLARVWPDAAVRARHHRENALIETVYGARFAASNRRTEALTGLDLTALGYT